MRQGQQNRRGRGRNRKGQSPLTRSFESTGPYVKIRGTPSHIAEKYMSLARDASSSGDPVLAENYLQHAEHYNRIIMAFREQQVGQGGEPMNGANRQRPSYMMHDPLDAGDDYDDDGDDMDMPAPQQMRADQQPQPRVDSQHFDGPRGGREQRFREPRSDRGFQPQRQPVAEAQPDVSPPEAPQQPRRRERFVQTHEQPEFLRRPVRRPRREGNGAQADANGAAVAEEKTDQD